jgi:hypothetical protein
MAELIRQKELTTYGYVHFPSPSPSLSLHTQPNTNSALLPTQKITPIVCRVSADVMKRLADERRALTPQRVRQLIGVSFREDGMRMMRLHRYLSGVDGE